MIKTTIRADKIRPHFPSRRIELEHMVILKKGKSQEKRSGAHKPKTTQDKEGSQKAEATPLSFSRPINIQERTHS